MLRVMCSILFLVSSCATFDPGGDILPRGGFRGTAAVRNQTTPLPVEIATDIAKITEEGQVLKKNEQVKAKRLNSGHQLQKANLFILGLVKKSFA